MKAKPSTVPIGVGSESAGSRTLYVDGVADQDLTIPAMFEALMSIKHDKPLPVPGERVR